MSLTERKEQIKAALDKATTPAELHQILVDNGISLAGEVTVEATERELYLIQEGLAAADRGEVYKYKELEDRLSEMRANLKNEAKA